MIRLEPMDEADFRAFVARAIPRRASKWVERGIWSQERSLEASQQAYSRLLPNGKDTPGNHFLKVIDASDGAAIGEVWYTNEEEGGRLQFWVEWIQIDPDRRRKGHATEVLQRLEEMASGLGATRIGLDVWTDNPGAMALYSKLGYRTARASMMKPLPNPRPCAES